MNEINELKKVATQIRRDILRMVNAPKSGHPGGSLGCVEYFVALYYKILKHDPSKFNIESNNEDAFFLSNGHISPVFYSTLARRGYFPVDELSTFRKIGSRLQGHPSISKRLPGIRIASGSLGQGLSVALGVANAKKLNNDNSLVYTLHGDGELQEGQIWEAAMYAASNKIDNLIATVDYNKQQIDGCTDDVLSLGDLKAKWAAFGWEVLEMNGNNLEEVINTLNLAKSKAFNKKPIVILSHSIMGCGVDFMENDHNWHGVAPNDEQLQKALSQLEETLGDYKNI